MYWIYKEINILLQYVEDDTYMDTYSNVTQYSLLGILTPTVFQMHNFAFQDTLRFSVLMCLMCISKLIIKSLYAIIVKGN